MGDVVRSKKMSAREQEAAWETAVSTTYSLDTFYTRSTDDDGHHSSIAISLPPHTAGRIDELLQKGLYPFKTKGHFVRDAIVHRLQYLAERGNIPELERFVALETRAARLAMIRYEDESMTNMIENYDQMLRMKRDRNDKRGIAFLLDDIRETAEEVGDPWDQTLLDLVNKYA